MEPSTYKTHCGAGDEMVHHHNTRNSEGDGVTVCSKSNFRRVARYDGVNLRN
jgi:hypothetical protein